MKTIYAIIAAMLIFPALGAAELQLDSIQFDPAIIAAGDEVDIVAQFHEAGEAIDGGKIGDPSYRFGVILEADDTLTREHVLLMDAEGDDLRSMVYANGVYNKRFRIKVENGAPAGTYEFKLAGQWYRDGVAEGATQFVRFRMEVKSEGVDLTVSNVVSEPQKVRSGDKNVLVSAQVSNAGEKAAKDVRLSLSYPDGISSSYTNDNALALGVVGPGEEKPIQAYLDTERDLREGVYSIGYTLTYKDLDNNAYTEKGEFPFVVKKRPHIVVVNSSAEARQGEETEIRVTLKNVGEETADAVDARILKQSSQPFEMDVRSDYVGELEPGEEAIAVFRVKVLDEAEIKEHRLNLMIRARGDAEEGDDNIYTFSESASVTVTGEGENNYPLYGAVFLGVVAAGALGSRLLRRKARAA